MRATGVTNGSVALVLQALFRDSLPKEAMQVTVIYKCICGVMVQELICANPGDNTFTTKCRCGRAHNGSLALEVQ